MRRVSLSIVLLLVLPYLPEAFNAPQNRLNLSPLRGRQIQDGQSYYEETSPLAKGVVAGLTSLFNILSPQPEVKPREYKKARLNDAEIVRGILDDFRRGYLFSGEIEAECYSEDCVFTDPTLSFQGLRKFESNIASIKPVLDTFLGANACILYSLTQDKRKREVYTKWRMIGDIKIIPGLWTPRLDLGGQTTFSYDPRENGGRVRDYYERWDISAGEALLQLLGRASPQSVEEIAKEEAITAKVVNFSDDSGMRAVL